VINSFKDLLARENLQDKVELKGSFCMERCGEGINWTIDDEVISSLSAQDSVQTLNKRLKDILENNTSQRPTEGIE
jgi:NADH:ubiquinone oxidoreductase subunit E